MPSDLHPKGIPKLEKVNIKVGRGEDGQVRHLIWQLLLMKHNHSQGTNWEEERLSGINASNSFDARR